MNDLSQKKLFIYIGLGVILFGAGATLVYLFLFRQGIPDEERGDAAGSDASGFPIAGPGIGKDPRYVGGIQPGSDREISRAAGVSARLFPVSGESAEGLALSEKEDALRYFKKDGGELRSYAFPAGSDESLSTIAIAGITSVLWAPTRDRVMISYLDADTVRSFIYRAVGTSSAATLPIGTRSFAWAPDGSGIAYTVEQAGETFLSVADASGKNPRTLTRIPAREFRVSWPKKDTLFLETLPSGASSGYLLSVSRQNGDIKKFLGPVQGLTVLWSPAGSRFLLGKTDLAGKSPALAVYDSAGKELFAPDIATLPEKCAWAGENTLYCAVPRGIPQSAFLPDDYLRGELHTSDRIARLDLKTKSVEGIINEGSYDMTNLVVTKDERVLFFIDRATGRPWGVEITR